MTTIKLNDLTPVCEQDDRIERFINDAHSMVMIGIADNTKSKLDELIDNYGSQACIKEVLVTDGYLTREAAVGFLNLCKEEAGHESYPG